MSKLKILAQIWKRISSRRKLQLFLTIIFINLVSVIEIISIGAVIPFLTILLNPKKIFEFEIISNNFQFLQSKNLDELTLIFTIIFCLSAIIAGIMRLILLLIQTKLSVGLGVDFSLNLFESTLYQPYNIHISRNSSEIHSGVRKVESLISFIFSPTLTLVGSLFISLSIFSMLIALNTTIAILIISIFIIIYGLIIKFTKNKIKINSKLIASKTTEMTKSIQEGTGAIRNILIDNSQKTFTDNFKQALLPLKSASAWNLVISQSPRYIIESLGIVALTIIAFTLASSENGIISFIPALGAFVLGIQKLMPIVQQTYGAIIDIKTGWESVKDVIELLEKENFTKYKIKSSEKLKFEQQIVLQNVSFRYSNKSQLILKNINLTILKGECLGIIGETGSGKSTLIDIIMGLLKPTSGILKIDNIELTDYKKTAKWQKNISHVPQSIFLTDASYRENIAFGQSKQKVNISKVVESSKLSAINDTIVSSNNQYDTIIGERGIRISGGQRQRIGLARALYKSSSLLILDEATSSVDNKTENKIIKNIIKNNKNMTIIMIAHRLSSLKYCDRIIEVSNKMIKPKILSEIIN